MPIGGVESIVYGVEDMEASIRFYDDFGLKRVSTEPGEVVYRLEEGSRVVLRAIDDPSLPAPHFEGPGVRETFFAVDSREELDRYAARIGEDREVRRSEGGNTIHFLSDCGIPLGLRVFVRQRVTYSPDPVNAPDNVKRLNQHRRWRVRALPKTINHVVWRVLDANKSFAFFRDRLDFRLSDMLTDIGVFGRSEGAAQHHVVFFQKFDSFGPPPYSIGWDHVAFGVEDIDEVFTGWNYMERRGYRNPMGGVGRHRIASAVFCYFDNPAGGWSEYGADTDYLDDNWVPRVWNPNFGGFTWTSRVPSFIPQEPPWEVSFEQSKLPQGQIPEKFEYPPTKSPEAKD